MSTDLEKRQPQAPITDAERLDALERFILEDSALVLWDGVGRFPGGSCGGLAFGGSKSYRNLRLALDGIVEAERRRNATRT